MPDLRPAALVLGFCCRRKYAIDPPLYPMVNGPAKRPYERPCGALISLVVQIIYVVCRAFEFNVLDNRAAVLPQLVIMLRV